MNKKELIAYRGTEFTIEWYYDANGKSQALEYLMNLDTSNQQKVFYLLKKEVIMKNKKKALSTFEKLMQNPNWKSGFEKGYEKFLISEFLIEAMEENSISVRKLAKKAGVSPTLIQNIRSGKSSNISINTLAPILSALHYRIEFVKDDASQEAVRE